MMALEQLALSGATTLLTYLQCDRLQDEDLAATAIAATLCEMLNQIEATHPGITDDYGWKKIAPADADSNREIWEARRIDGDRAPGFDFTRLS
ncbi:hypothetical protein K9N68_09070 [Kovacikia minuta CCNUW1]|uniref:hypothetical protein n=1 Tax=Kovacikia minuta TaxID=2931930 RepID=UPI001CCFB7E0|nr:hypothetical protein [Kovacikia minuta]UBF28024.1 hypothetical protein K9N68_09070 [Kovacikia minuta CCNUW1]